MKSPDEIKKGLEYHNDCCSCGRCAYYSIGGARCSGNLTMDALDYIQQLEEKLNKAVNDFRLLGSTGAFICPVCVNYNHGEGDKQKCINCIINREKDNFEWRGMKEGGV